MKACKAAHRAAAATADGAAFFDAVSSGQSGRARRGKIARLPHAAREALNERLRDGVPSGDILSWLNGLPAVREMLQKHFESAAIGKENLSSWRRGGYAGWVGNQQIKEAVGIMAAACRDIGAEQRDDLTDQISLVMKARMVVELRLMDDMPEGPLKSARWGELVRLLTLLRRGEYYHEKMRLERDKLPPPKPEEREECNQERQERYRRILGLGGPQWNNFTKQWEGPGAAEMVEKEEVHRMVLAELERRKAARKAAAAAAANPTPPAPKPGVSAPDSAVPEAKPVVATPDSVAPTAKPTVAASESVAPTPKPAAPETKPVVAEPKPAVTESKPSAAESVPPALARKLGLMVNLPPLLQRNPAVIARNAGLLARHAATSAPKLASSFAEAATEDRGEYKKPA